MSGLLKILGKNNTDLITFQDIREGSIVFTASVDSSADAGTPTFNSEYTAISTALSASSIGGMPITSSSISLPNQSSVKPENGTPIGMIVGIAVGVSALVLGIVGFLIYKLVCKKNVQNIA